MVYIKSKKGYSIKTQDSNRETVIMILEPLYQFSAQEYQPLSVMSSI
jgi:hypothetical protein